ncbi:Squalene/phytoene synthase [Niveomyces insectorum RCEF 264]|uniref:Squalene/phytoene synthase n=1 Tax=Niveomyces insectorum RCEF 264 TaxID=1081102 RepID=A0A167WAU8_9HYPO|nr:Squalene/phytoene synthase [Niveomyces insectorum RCEF 264]
MLCVRRSRNALRWSPSRCPGLGLRRTFVSDADVDKARAYCVNQLRTGDYDAYLVRHFLPPAVRDAYLALRTLNLELARLPETVSSPTIGNLRVQFRKDAINHTFEGQPPREPVSLLLYAALAALAARTAGGGGGGGSGGSGDWSAIKFWLQRVVSTRQQYMDNRPFVSLAALEDYAEGTYATLAYVTLAMLPLRSVHVDHLASHIGKACGIAAVLRGIPVLASPAAAKGNANANAVGGGGAQRSPVLLLPLDVLADAGVREEDVYRQGPEAPGLQDAVFRVATRANDHLITAREMLKNLRAGEDLGHAYEHAGETGHTYGEDGDEGGQGNGRNNDKDKHDQRQALQRGFGVLLEAVPAQDFLTRLEAANFDAFRVKSGWKLPWSLYRAQKTQRI